MSEEKPTFKITDRRLFNPDGTPREGAREEEPAAPVPEASTVDREPVARAGSVAEAPADAARAAATGRASEAEAAGRPRTAEEEEFGEADDPSSFINLAMILASPAAAALGMAEHPSMSGRDVDLPLAKQWIDLLGTLERKTRGNLSAQEEQFFEGLLADLRMQYLSLSKARPSSSGPRGFTGSDITGAR